MSTDACNLHRLRGWRPLNVRLGRGIACCTPALSVTIAYIRRRLFHNYTAIKKSLSLSLHFHICPSVPPSVCLSCLSHKNLLMKTEIAFVVVGYRTHNQSLGHHELRPSVGAVLLWPHKAMCGSALERGVPMYAVSSLVHFLLFHRPLCASRPQRWPSFLADQFVLVGEKGRPAVGS